MTNESAVRENQKNINKTILSHNSQFQQKIH